MQTSDWTVRFKALYEKARARYDAGHRDAATLFNPGECAFLETIGARPIELYDFAEDAGGIDWETALLIAAARRDYFWLAQKNAPSPKRFAMSDFPPKDAELQGIPWLPRLILKAGRRLRGEMPDDMMYCCAGDRRFFKQYGIHPADFLRFVWAVDGNESRILEYVKGTSNIAPPSR